MGTGRTPGEDDPPDPTGGMLVAFTERDAARGAGVDDLVEHTCLRCGASTFGPSTCHACLEALRELRALAEEPPARRRLADVPDFPVLDRR